MVKQVPKSDQVRAILAKVVGDEAVNADDYAVFEAIFANTLPLRRQGGIYEGARIGADMLAAAAERLNAGETIPLALMHRSGLPSGRVMSAKLRPAVDGSTELVGMFFLPKSEIELVTKLDTGTINEVSINFMPSQLLCSECGFDYMSDEATFDNLWGCVCANGHKIGKNGVHVRVHGLKSWNELSLVDRGAVNGAKILPRSEQTDPARLAARGFDNRILALCASASDALPPPPENPEMTPEAVETAAKLIVAERDLAAATTKITDLEAKLAAAEAKVTELSASDAAQLKVDRDAAVGLVDEIGKATLAALGRGTENLPEIISDRVKLVKDLRASLTMVIPPGGAARPASDADTDTKVKANFSAFKRA